MHVLCVDVHRHLCACISVCMHMHACKCVRVCLCVCVCACACACVVQYMCLIFLTVSTSFAVAVLDAHLDVHKRIQHYIPIKHHSSQVHTYIPLRKTESISVVPDKH